MSQKYPEISPRHKAFINQQKVFFVATAAREGSINLSPKGMDSLRVMGAKRIVWLNVTGSGNETSAHVQENGRITLMMMALEGKPLILRLYGTANVIHTGDDKWSELYALFDPIPGARQIFDVTIRLVQTSCGMAVPRFDFVSERPLLRQWAEEKGAHGIQEFWRTHNQISLDEIPTNIGK